MITLIGSIQNLFDKYRSSIDFIAPLMLRIYLVPVFWFAANNKWNPFDSESSLDNTISWFGNTEWGLGLPFPALNAYMAWGMEYFGAILLALGIATRWISIPLMIIMVVAMGTVHIENGWQAVHDPMSPYASANAGDAIERLSIAKDIIKENGNYSWLTEHGNFIVLNNGIEWAVTYFIMLLALLMLGGGKFVSIDYWIARKYK